MPLQPCPDCGRDVSTEALSCPQCGRPMKRSQSAEFESVDPVTGTMLPGAGTASSTPGNQKSANTAVIFIAVVIGAILLLVVVSAFCNGMAERGVHF